MISAELNQQDLQRFNRKLDRLASKLHNPTQANRAASIALYGAVIRNFDNQNRAYGGWVPLSPRTVKEKLRIGKEVPLVRSGHLRQGFVPFYSADNAGVRNAVEYASVHHEGYPPKNIPRRPLFPPRQAVLEVGMKVYGLYVEQQVKEAS